VGEVNEVQSSIALHVKCISTFDVNIDSSLKVKRRILVITGCEPSSNSKEKGKEEE